MKKLAVSACATLFVFFGSVLHAQERKAIGYVCKDEVVAITAIKEIVSKPDERFVIWQVTEVEGLCKRVRYNSEEEESYLKVRPAFIGGAWEFNFYLTQKGKVLVTTKKRRIEFKGWIVPA